MSTAASERAWPDGDTSYLPPGLPVPVARPDGLDAPYWEAARRHRLVVQRCVACRTWQWGPDDICHRCRSFELGFEEVAPSGVLYSWQRVWHPVHPALGPAVPYVVALVELPQAGGVRMVGNLLGDPRAAVAIGTTVDAVFEDHDTTEPPYTLVQWRVREAAP